MNDKTDKKRMPADGTPKKKTAVKSAKAGTAGASTAAGGNSAPRAGAHQRWTDSLTEQERALLAVRARQHANSQEKQAEEDERVAYIRFRLGSSEQYGIPYAYADEIVYADGLAKVPSTPAFIAGVINRRGEMLTVLDLSVFFQASGADLDDNARILVVSGAGLTVGLLVNAVEGNDDYHPSRLAAALPSGGVSNLQYVKGIHRGSITILDLGALLRDPAIRVGERAP